MALVSLGSVTIDTAVPSIGFVCGIAAPNVTAQITALASFTPSVSLSFGDQLTLAADVTANLNAAIAAVPPIPVLDLSAQVTLAASISAALSATLAQIQAIVSLLASAGIDLYAWDGANNALGPALTTALGGATTHSNALILYTQSGATWTAMGSLMKTT